MSLVVHPSRSAFTLTVAVARRASGPDNGSDAEWGSVPSVVTRSVAPDVLVLPVTDTGAAEAPLGGVSTGCTTFSS